MKISYPLSLLSVCLALSLTGYEIFRWQTENTQNIVVTDKTNSEADMAALKQELAELRQTVATLQNTKKAEPSIAMQNEITNLKSSLKGLQNTQSDNANTENADLTPALTEAEIQAQMQEQKEATNQFITQLDQKFVAETADRQWANKVTQHINGAFESNELSKASIVGLECRTTLCKLEVSFDDPQTMQETQRWLAYKLSDSLPNFSAVPGEQGSDGQSNSTIYYFSRKGADANG
jgi:hypothetical protein